MNNTILTADERYIKAAEIISSKEGFQASIVESKKCNGTKLAMMVRKEGSVVVPGILLKPLKDSDYAEDIAEKIFQVVLDTYENESGSKLQATAKHLFQSFDIAKSNIFSRVCQAKGNEDYLNGAVCDRFLDLAVFYVVQLGQDDVGGRVIIKEEHLKAWGVDKETIQQAAEQNEQSALVYTYGNMHDLFNPCTGLCYPEKKVFSIDDICPGGMYMLTYEDAFGGASIILRNGFLKSISDKTECDLIIVPSSVEDIIVMPLPHIRYEDISIFGGMVQDVNYNSDSVKPEKVLSDHVYVFNREAGRILDQAEVLQTY